MVKPIASASLISRWLVGEPDDEQPAERSDAAHGLVGDVAADRVVDHATLTSPGPGVGEGRSRSTRCSGSPSRSQTIARMRLQYARSLSPAPVPSLDQRPIGAGPARH